MTNARIIQLPLLVANQIAAGEVVERPASVVKELLENSIDAKATKIEIEIEGGGLHLIRVRDNGTGILKDDLSLAFLPHATSKIRNQTDLEAILTMGFRGEALGSIASVSRCRLASKPSVQAEAWQVQFGADLAPTLSPCAHPDGTTVEVADLFHNTPVRRKFLRSEKTEFLAIEEIVKRLALAFPHVTISLKHQQKLIRHYPKAAMDCRTRLAKICANQFVDNAVQFTMQAGSLALRGWVGFPHLARRTADCQYFFVNQRIIKDRLINHVIKTVYTEHPDMVLGTYPSYVLYLTLDPTEVDVNVHPTKQEVRFSQARMVHDFLSKCVRDALFQIKEEPTFTFQEQIDLPYEASPSKEIANSRTIAQPRANTFSYKSPANHHIKQPLVGALQSFIDAIPTECEKPAQAQKRYVFLEDNEGIIIIDLFKAKASLTTFFFEEHRQTIQSKTLRFPIMYHAKKTLVNPEILIDSFLQYGFMVLIEKNEIRLLQQPALVKESISQALFALLVEAALNKTLPAALAKEINMEFEPTLLAKWVELHPQGPWTRINHEMIEQLFLKEAIYPSEML